MGVCAQSQGSLLGGPWDQTPSRSRHTLGCTCCVPGPVVAHSSLAVALLVVWLINDTHVADEETEAQRNKAGDLLPKVTAKDGLTKSLALQATQAVAGRLSREPRFRMCKD